MKNKILKKDFFNIMKEIKRSDTLYWVIENKK
jgi:hypothetical protein